MELRNLNTFMKVAEIQNFSQAAEELGYSQSAITVQIRQLEGELGVRLFDRIGKNIVITQYGRDFIGYASAVLEAAARAEAFAATPETLRGTVTVGTLESILTGVFSKIVPAFHSAYPQIDTLLKDEAVDQLKESLDHNTVDLILTLDQPLSNKNWVKLYEKKEEIVVVANAELPIARRERVTLEDLVSQEFILMPQNSCYRIQFDQALQDHNLTISPFLELESTYTAIRLIREQPYLSVLPRYAVQNWIGGGKLKILNVEGCHMFEYLQLLHHKNKVITPQIQAILDTILECLNQVD